MRPSAYVYILTNKTKTTLYIGVTTDLPTRLWEHRNKQSGSSFTARYNLFILVYYEGFTWLTHAIKREKYIKGKTREWKEELIYTKNPVWRDLADDICALNR
jgi:putative endonuclease